MTKAPKTRPQATGPETPPVPLDRRRSGRGREPAARDERGVLAAALAILATPLPAETRLGDLLALLARSVGAIRAATLTRGSERYLAVGLGAREDQAAGSALGAWLDVSAPGTRAERAAAAPAPIAYVTTRAARAGVSRLRRRAGGPAFALVSPSRAGSVLGFELADRAAADQVAERLPEVTAHHAAVVLGLIAREVAVERELADLRARAIERERYVSTVAHELKTPLTGLGGYVDLLLGSPAPEPAVVKEFLERSRHIVASMAELVDDLLELSRIEAGTLELAVGPVSLTELAERAIDQVSPIALERGIALRSSLPPRLRTALGDRRRVGQVLINLLGNALKFTPPEGAVEVAVWFDGAAAILVVRDDGPGIPAENRPQVFERFFRLDAHRSVAGTGLGLPIARELARAMGGDLDVASVPGRGSSFVLVLPGPSDSECRTCAGALERALYLEAFRLSGASRYATGA